MQFDGFQGMNVDPTEGLEPSATPVVEFICRRNCSIGPRAMMLVFASLAAVSFGVGATFAALGPWLILPFAGIEMVALALAFVLCARRAGDFERIRLLPHVLTVEHVQGQRQVVHQFNPQWAKLEIVHGALSIRVLLSQAGRRLELGRHLGFQQRCAFATAFKAAYGKVGRA